MKLYEIDQAIMDLVDNETGDIVDIEMFDSLQMERDEKIESIALYIKDLKAEAEALKAEKLAFAERQKVAENKAESLKNYLAYALKGQAFKSTKAVVSFRKTQQVDIPDIYKLDENFLKYAEPTADKTAIKEAIKAGQTVKGATLIENTSVIIK